MSNYKTGKYLTYCEKHQREYWRDHSSAKRPGKNALKPQPPLNDSVGDNGTAVEMAHAEVAKTSRLSDADKQRLINESRARVLAKQVAAPAPTDVDRRFKDTYSVEDIQKISASLGLQSIPFEPPVVHTTTTAADECASGCNDCLYRDVVEMLEKRVPGVRELVEGLKTIHGQK